MKRKGRRKEMPKGGTSQLVGSREQTHSHKREFAFSGLEGHNTSAQSSGLSAPSGR